MQTAAKVYLMPCNLDAMQEQRREEEKVATSNRDLDNEELRLVSKQLTSEGRTCNLQSQHSHYQPSPRRG